MALRVRSPDGTEWTMSRRRVTLRRRRRTPAWRHRRGYPTKSWAFTDATDGLDDGRPWLIDVRGPGKSYTVLARGWRKSRKTMDELAEKIQAGRPFADW